MDWWEVGGRKEGDRKFEERVVVVCHDAAETKITWHVGPAGVVR